MENKKQKTWPFGMTRELYRLNVGFGVALLGITLLTAFVLFVSAASLTNRKDQMSDQTKSRTSAHQVSFNLSGGNTFTTGEQIAVDFPASFTNGGTWTIADFTFTDGTARTVNAVNQGAGISTVVCTDGANNIGVAVDTTALTFRAIPCGASFVASASGAFVTFVIDGSGANGTLTNPSTAGSYIVNVLNAGGDCTSGNDSCSMSVAIVDDGDVTVTAEVSSLCGNGVVNPPEQCDDGNTNSGDGCSATCTTEGGGPPPPPPDTTPPVISNVRAENITTNSANVKWDTNEASNSLVRYGLTASYGSTASDAGFVLAHSVAVTGLAEGTLYHYQVCSTDTASNQGCSGDNTFTTLDTTPPVISNVQVTSITETSATVTWTTNEPASSFVDFDTDGPPYSTTEGSATLVTSHTVNLTGLTASTTYHYRVRSGDASSNESFTSDATFTTLAPADSTPPVISNIQVTSITATSATVTWTTNEPATSFVDYDTDGAPYANTTGNVTLVTSHSVNLTGLTGSTLYHYRVRSADAALNSAASSDATFTTADGTPPVISNIQVTGITQTSATVTWTTNEAATNFVDYGLAAGPPYSNTSGNATLVTSHSVNLTGLTAGTTYHYSVRSADAAANSASSADATFITLVADTTPPVISNVQVSSITQNSATVTWTTNEPATSFVDYDTDGSPYANTAGNATLVTSHSVNLTGLTAGTTYHYSVRSADAANNSASSGNATFTTAAAPDTTPPVISNIQVISLTATGATITWTTNEPATSFVDYDTDGSPYANTAGNGTLVTSHSVNLTGLTQNTLYHYRVRSADAATNSAASPDDTFTTLDADAPAISNVQVTNITGTSATVTWTTNEPSTSFVDYDTDGTPYASNAGNGTMVTSHTVNLTGLSDSTTYHFSVRSADPQGNSTSTPDDTFTTADTTPPVISAITATNLTPTGATITWTTSEPSDSVVQYGTTITYGSTQSSGTMVTSHSVNLTGLSPDTIYHFRVRSKDVANNEAVSGDNTFTTPKPPPPIITAIQVTNITFTTATISWTTDIPSTSQVDYGLDTLYGTTRGDAVLVTSHSVDIDGLSKNKTYHFKVSSTDTYAQTSSSSDQTFNSAVDATPPGNVTGFTATPGNGVITLNWGNPTDPDFVAMRIMRKEGSFPTGPNDGTQIYQDDGTSYVDAGLTNGVEYFYGAFATDDVPNYSSGSFASATPGGAPDTTPPPDVSGFAATPGDTQVSLTWTNPGVVDFIGVRIMRKTGGFPTGPSDGILAYDGNGQSHTDAGLTNDTTYFYKAFSYDGSFNYSSGVEASAMPTQPPDNTPPANVSNLNAIAGDAQVQVTWQNPGDTDWAGTRIVRKVGSDPTNQNDGTVVFDGVGDNVLDTNVVNGTTYHYGAFAHDEFPNYSSGAFDNATPTQGAPPPPPLACSDSDGGQNYDEQGTVQAGTNNYTDSCSDSTHVIENYCDAGAHTTEIHDCGAGNKCSGGRCVADTFTPSGAVCGNSICEQGETSLNCAQDCPVPPTEPPAEEPPPTVSQEDKLDAHDFVYTATAAKVELRLAANDTLQVYRSMALRVYLPNASIRKPITSASINFAGGSYSMRPTASYEGVVTTPPVTGDYPMSILVNYEDGTTDNVQLTVAVKPHGLVYESINGTDTPVQGGRVTLLIDNGGGNYGVWPAELYAQTNPQMTGEGGTFTFVVPIGTYKLKAEKDGYLTKETLPFPVNGENVITTRLQLIKVPPPIAQELQDIFSGDGTAGEKISDVAGAIGDQISFGGTVVSEQVTETIDNPFVEEQAQNVAVPTAVAVGLANVATAGAATATAIPYALYIYSFLAHPALLIARRRRKKWGVVYNSLSKLPIDLVIVRLLDAATGRIIRSAVTDKDGRYFFIVQKGQYRMSAAKAGYVFPSVLLKSQKEDVHYVDLYHGELIDVKEETAITANLPLDPVTKEEKTPKKLMWEGIARRFQKSIGIVAIIAMGIAAIITPTPIVIAMFVLNVLLYAAFKRMSVTKKPKNWGIVYDETTGKPVQNAVARIFEARFNKLLETQVTDVRGRYSFLVGNNVYYVTFEKPGYQKQQKGPVDLLAKPKEGEKVVAIDVRLQKQGAGETKSSTAPTPPAPPAPPSTPPAPAAPAPAPKPPTPPAPPAPAAPAAAPAAPAPKIPWELQMLQKNKGAEPPKKDEAVIKTMHDVAKKPEEKKEEKKEDIKLIEDADHAHPDEKGKYDTNAQ